MTTENLKKKAREYGYLLLHVNKKDNYTKLELWPEGEFVPELNFESEDFGESGEWTVQTTSYGSLTLDGMKPVLEGLQNGTAFARYLNSINYDELEEYHIGNDSEAYAEYRENKAKKR